MDIEITIDFGEYGAFGTMRIGRRDQLLTFQLQNHDQSPMLVLDDLDAADFFAAWEGGRFEALCLTSEFIDSGNDKPKEEWPLLFCARYSDNVTLRIGPHPSKWTVEEIAQWKRFRVPAARWGFRFHLPDADRLIAGIHPLVRCGEGP